MADGISVSVDKASMQRIKHLLGDLPTTVLLNGLRTGSRKIVKGVLSDAQANLDQAIYSRSREEDERMPTGALKSALSLKVRAKRKTGQLYAGVGIDAKVTLYDIKTKKKIKPVNYGRLVEHGHKARGGGVVPPKPFMRPAVAKLGPDNGAEILVDNVIKSVERAARKAAKGGGKR